MYLKIEKLSHETSLYLVYGEPLDSQFTLFPYYCSFALFGHQIQICCSVPPEPLTVKLLVAGD